jgi:putative ABC transport system permease protein
MILFRLKRTFKLGGKSLLRHLLRSMLTMLGIVFGVGAVVSMLAVGEGASYESQERIKRLGSQNIIIRSVKPSEEQAGTTGTARHGLQASAYGLTYADAEAIRSTVPGVEVLVPVREVRRDIWHGPAKINGRVLGTVPWYLDTLGQKVQKGRFLSSIDAHGRKPVCVIGFEVSETVSL